MDTGHLQLPSRHISKPEASLSCMLSNLQLPLGTFQDRLTHAYCERLLGTNKPDALLSKAESSLLEAMRVSVQLCVISAKFPTS